jgi:hypothetical protein
MVKTVEVAAWYKAFRALDYSNPAVHTHVHILFCVFSVESWNVLIPHQEVLLNICKRFVVSKITSISEQAQGTWLITDEQEENNYDDL